MSKKQSTLPFIRTRTYIIGGIIGILGVSFWISATNRAFEYDQLEQEWAYLEKKSRERELIAGQNRAKINE